MAWSCRRPGCGREAEVCISYDAVACQVWLDPLGEAPPGGQPLCADHAERLRPPRGWIVLDRRESQATLLTAATVAAAAGDAAPAPRPTLKRRLPRAWGQFEAPTLEFLADADEPDADEPDSVPAAAAVEMEPATAIVEPEPEPEPEVEVVEPEPESEPVAKVVEPEPVPAPVVEVVEPELEAQEAEPESESEPEPESEPVPAPRRAVKARKKNPTRRGAGAPTGRLLSRAFESAGDQRSAITEALAAAGDQVESSPDND